MNEFILRSEPLIRLSTSLGVFLSLALLEVIFARRNRPISRLARWPNNIGVTVFDAVLTRIVLPTSAVGFGALAESRQWGLFNHLFLPFWIEVILAVIMLDLAIYGQHVLFHRV